MLEATPISVVLKGLEAMTVCTTYLALDNFGLDSRPAKALSKQIRYFTRFLSVDVIKFEKAYVCLTTIDTRVRGEMSIESGFILNKYLSEFCGYESGLD